MNGLFRSNELWAKKSNLAHVPAEQNLYRTHALPLILFSQEFT